jgi:hypothetical protein
MKQLATSTWKFESEKRNSVLYVRVGTENDTYPKKWYVDKTDLGTTGPWPKELTQTISVP